MRTSALLTIPNIFMTFAWYGPLEISRRAPVQVIPRSGMIAFFECCFQVPANRIGSYEFTAAQLKTYSGSHYSRGLFRFLGFLFEAADSMEPHRRLRNDHYCRRHNFQKMVETRVSIWIKALRTELCLSY